MNWNADLTELRDKLLDLYQRNEDVRRVADDAGLRCELINFQDRPINIWYNILAEASRSRKLRAIIEIACKEYPNQRANLIRTLGLYLAQVDEFLATVVQEPVTILIPAGIFLMGNPNVEELVVGEYEQHEVYLSSYRIGKYPVTNGQYAKFIQQHPYQDTPRGWFLRKPPESKCDHPVVDVSWHDALAYCNWLKDQTGRAYCLPSEAEWEKAARGTDGRRYPWGNKWRERVCNTGTNDTTSVTAFPDGSSPYGCVDLVGNVQEWTRTLWGDDPEQNAFSSPYRPHDGREGLDTDKYQESVYRVYRGGKFNDDRMELACWARDCSHSGTKIRWRGFRVACPE